MPSIFYVTSDFLTTLLLFTYLREKGEREKGERETERENLSHDLLLKCSQNWA